MCSGSHLVTLYALLLLPLVCNLRIVLGGTCWSSAMVRNGKCTELISESISKEECCTRFGVATAWSGEQHDSGTLFFFRMLGGGVACTPCKDTCSGVECGAERKCSMRSGRPRCVCAPQRCSSRRHRHQRGGGGGAVCGTDGRSYRNVCRLKKRACRRRNASLSVAYNGVCQNSCDRVSCAGGKRCLLDQNHLPHCVHCARRCPASETSAARRRVCGVDGVTYASVCHLRERACRRGAAVPVAYKGACRMGATCRRVHCGEGQTCLEDDGRAARCVTCAQTCKPKHLHGPICGSDNRTYTTWCSMMQEACATHHVIETKHSGKCLTNELY